MDGLIKSGRRPCRGQAVCPPVGASGSTPVNRAELRGRVKDLIKGSRTALQGSGAPAEAPGSAPGSCSRTRRRFTRDSRGPDVTPLRRGDQQISGPRSRSRDSPCSIWGPHRTRDAASYWRQRKLLWWCEFSLTCVPDSCFSSGLFHTECVMRCASCPTLTLKPTSRRKWIAPLHAPLRLTLRHPITHLHRHPTS